MTAVRGSKVGAGGAVLALLLTALAVVPAVAQSAPGDLTFSSCVANAGGSGCADPPRDSLEAASSIAVSPDGTSVYVGSDLNGNAVTRFGRLANGDLIFGDCTGDILDTGCPISQVSTLRSVSDVAVSPNSASIYTTAGSLNSGVTIFHRFTNGSMDFDSCITNNTGVAGCFTNPKKSLDQASGVAVSPDGTAVYVSSRLSDSLSHFVRNPDGSLGFVDCVASTGDDGCIDAPLNALDGARSVAISPDGKSVYLVSDNDNSISRFSVGPNGAPTFVDCIADAGGSGCSDPPLDSLTRPTGVVVSPDGKSVYVASETADSITQLNRAPDGSLTYAGCIANAGAKGCADPPSDSLDAVQDIAVSPSGRSVYAAAAGSNAVTHFTRGADGGLAFANCTSSLGNADCTDPPLDALDGASDVAVSPDGEWVYVAAATARAVSVLKREPDDAQPPGITLKVKKAKAGKPISATISCTEACSVDLSGKAKPKGSRRGNLKPAATSLAPSVPDTLKLKPKGKLKKALRRKGKGKATVTAVATDAFGNSAEATKKVKLK